MMNGLPDVCGVYRGVSIWVETKMPGNQPTITQLARHNAIRKSGGIVLVAENVSEVSELLDAIDTTPTGPWWPNTSSEMAKKHPPDIHTHMDTEGLV